MAEAKQVETAELRYGGKTLVYPVLEGTEGERALDIRKLRAQTGLITYTPGSSTPGRARAPSLHRRREGHPPLPRLRHRRPGGELHLIEVAYLLVHGKLPNKAELADYSKLLNRHSMLHEEMAQFFSHYPERAHPMAIASAMAVSLSSFYPEMESLEEARAMAATRLLSSCAPSPPTPTRSHRRAGGAAEPEDVVLREPPEHDVLVAVNEYKPDPYLVKAINTLLLLHADHEQNASTSWCACRQHRRQRLRLRLRRILRPVGAAAWCANQEVMDMLEAIHRAGATWTRWSPGPRIQRPLPPLRLRPPRLQVLRPAGQGRQEICQQVLKKMNRRTPSSTSR